MAPINLPDGSQVSEIVLPDGSTASEVLAPDGSTVFSAIPDTLVDSFEDQDLTEYGGDTGSFSVTQTFVTQGDYGLEGTATSGGDINIYSSSGLNHYPDGTDPYRLWVRWSNSNARLFVYYGRQDGDNQYRLDISNGQLRLRLFDGGNFSTIDTNSSPGLSESTDYDLEIDWEPGSTHTVTVYDSDGNQQAQISGSESAALSETGIGLGVNDTGSNDATGYFDYARAGREPAGPP